MNGGDFVRKMTNDELEEWFWWMLRYTKNFTSSYVALHEWLNTEIEEE